MPKRNAKRKTGEDDEEEERERYEKLYNQPPPPDTIFDHCPDTTVNPYELMGITRDATAADVKRAYKKGALRWHPDKHPEDEKHKAQKAFQQLTTAYAVLSDPVRRKHYDATGKVHEALHMDPDDPWRWQPFFQYWWAEMAEGDIDAFAKEYRFSEEERHDLLTQYTTHKGDMSIIYEHVTLSDPIEDDDRYRKWINEAIKNEEVKPYKAFTHESAESIKFRKEEAKMEAEEAEELKKMLQDSGEWFDPPEEYENHELLALSIREKNKSRTVTFLDNLMAKYGSKSTKKGAEPWLDEPPEEAFKRNHKKSFEEALKRDKERGRKRASASSKKRKADEIGIDADGSGEEHPVKKWNKQRKKVKRQQEEDRVAEIADPSTEESDIPDQEERDEIEDEIYGGPVRDDENEPETTSKSKATVKKTASRSTRAKAIPATKTRLRRGTRAVVLEDDEEDEEDEEEEEEDDEDDEDDEDEEEEGNIELGSSDSDEYDEDEE